MLSGRTQIWFSTLAPPACALILFYWLVCRTFFVNDLVPGDLGDGRFNVYVLEQIYRWLSGQEASLSSPAVFYPFPGVLFFSDTHAGSAALYVFFRALGLNEYRAFTLWFFIGYFLTFAATYYTALRLGYRPFISLVVATVFSFSLPSLAQFGHAQLVYRFAVPLAFLNCWNFVRTGAIKQLFWLVIWLGLEMLCSVYLGIFLTLACAAFLFATLYLSAVRRSFRLLTRAGFADAVRLWRQNDIHGALLLSLAIVVAGAAIALLAQYRDWADLYGFDRTWEAVYSSVPRLGSYLVMDDLPYWRKIDEALFHVELDGRNEHKIFMGFGVLCLFLTGAGSLLSSRASDRNYLARSSLMTVIVIVLFTTNIAGHTAYFFLFQIPGVHSIRAVARISVVLMFPVSLVAAEGVGVLLNSLPRTPVRVALAIFLTFVALDIVMIRKPVFSIKEAEWRTTAIAEEARRAAAGKTNPVLSLREDWQAPYLTHLDAMLAAQRLGWATSNGYSGNFPPGYEYELTDDSPAHLFAGYEAWHAHKHAGPDLTAAGLLQRDIRIGSVACSNSEPPRASFGPPPAFDVARQMQILPISFEKADTHLNLGIAIHYDGETCVHGSSLTPIRLSWRFVPVGYDDDKDVDKIGWGTRLQVPEDIVPGRDLKMKVTADIPSKPGIYNIEFSMVAELSFWFHDRGTKILRFEQPISVP